MDSAAIERLIASLQRLLDPAAALTTAGRTPAAGTTAAAGPELRLLESRPMGGTHVLDGLWQRLGIDAVMAKLLVGRRLDPRVERVLFALVANRALDVSSKLAAAGWVSDDACYRAMGWLIEIAQDLEKEVFWQVGTLLDLEVDLLFFDTTSTYFERDTADEPVGRDGQGPVAPKPDDDTPRNRPGQQGRRGRRRGAGGVPHLRQVQGPPR